MPNAFEEAWVQQVMARSLQQPQSASSQAAPGQLSSSHPPAPATGDVGAEEEDLQRALRESKEDAERQQAQSAASQCFASSQAAIADEEDAALQRALRESALEKREFRGIRRIMGPNGPFFPAGLANSGNSCFWNALLQVLFAATPIFRGALFQLALHSYDEKEPAADTTTVIVGMLRDLFAEMDMGLVDTIDAGDLYRTIFQRAEEADVTEQMQRLFELLAGGPGPVKAVFSELFSGDLYEHLHEAASGSSVRRVPLDFCQLDLCVTKPISLEIALEEHTRDVQGSISRRSYRLPPVLWLNIDRFVYDRTEGRGRKREVPMTFPEELNAWMLVPPEAPWLEKIRACAKRREELREALCANREAVARHTNAHVQDVAEQEEALLGLVERQEALIRECATVDEAMRHLGGEQELLYHLEAVIVHRGRVDSGHYYAYARSPCPDQPGWCCLNDSTVSVCSTEEMLQICEGGIRVAEATPPPSPRSEPSAPASSVGAAAPQEPASPAAWRSALAPATSTTVVPTVRPVQPESGYPDPAATACLRAPPDKASQPRPAISVSSAPRREQRSSGKRQGVWSSMSSMFGCFQKPSASSPDSPPQSCENISVQDSPPRSPIPMAARQPESRAQENATGHAESAHVPTALPTTLSPSAEVSSQPGGSKEVPCEMPKKLQRQQTRDVTAARCLVYVRSSVGGERLLSEVRQRVPVKLQERIDSHNMELLRQRIEVVAQEFAQRVRQMTEHTAANELVEAALRVASRVRAEGGMARARMYLLRDCWRMHIPWLPEELCPTATPPDVRMLYGSAAKSMLLDALIKRGQHDVANLIVADSSVSDAFVPTEMERWFSSQGF